MRNVSEQVPAVLLGMMGVDEEFRGQRMGAALLRDAMSDALKISALSGTNRMVLRLAVDERQ